MFKKHYCFSLIISLILIFALPFVVSASDSSDGSNNIIITDENVEQIMEAAILGYKEASEAIFKMDCFNNDKIKEL